MKAVRGQKTFSSYRMISPILEPKLRKLLTQFWLRFEEKEEKRDRKICIFKDSHSQAKKSNRTMEADIHKMCRVMHDDSKLVVPPSKWRH